jgi:purine-cytosine permease-like protein
LVAQRPLPSMMMAMWRGTFGASGTAVVELLKIINLAKWRTAQEL